jgi:hypothetical protein
MVPGALHPQTCSRTCPRLSPGTDVGPIDHEKAQGASAVPTIWRSSNRTSGSPLPIAWMALAGHEVHTGIRLSRVDLYRDEALDEGLIGPDIAAGGWP